jgi:Arc/MetJ family transcription regulator
LQILAVHGSKNTRVDILMAASYVSMAMRTTVRLDPDLLAEAKKTAAVRGKTLTAVIEDALRESLSRRNDPKRRKKVKLPTFGGQGIQPGVNLDDSAALLELMESDRDSDRRERVGLRTSRRRR